MSDEERIAALTRRLEDGWNRIGEAERQGKDVHEWQAFWAQLLREYETLCDEMDRQWDEQTQAALL